MRSIHDGIKYRDLSALEYEAATFIFWRGLILEMAYCVYKHTSPSGKVYIGITAQRVKKRWQAGFGYKRNSHFWNAIQKYGWDNFSHEILYTGLTAEEAFEEEKRLIAEYKSNDQKFGYNLSCGGESGNTGVKMPDHVKENLIRLSTGRHPSEETRKKLSAARKGVKFTEEHKRKISESLKGKPREGHPMAEEAKEKIRQANLGRKNPHKGVPRSAETRKKLSESLKGKLAPNRKKVICVETGEIFDSLTEGAKCKGTNEQNVSACLRGKRNKAGGYHWEFYKEGEHD